MKNICLSIVLCFSALCAKEVSLEQESQPYPFVEDSINVLTGKYAHCEVDLVVQAIEPIILNRATHQFRLYKGLSMFYPHLYLECDNRFVGNIDVRVNSGFVLSLKKTQNAETYVLDNDVYPQGIPTMDVSTSRGAQLLESITAQKENNEIIVSYPNGDQRIYSRTGCKGLYVLREEVLFKGTHITYNYDTEYRIKYIRSYSKNKDKLYAWVKFLYREGQNFVIHASDGQRVSYEFEAQKHSSLKVFNLVKVSTSSGKTEKYSYIRRKKGEFDDVKLRELPNNNQQMFFYHGKKHKIVKTCFNLGESLANEAYQEVAYNDRERWCAITRGKTQTHTYHFDSLYRMQKIEKRGISSRKHQVLGTYGHQEIEWHKDSGAISICRYYDQNRLLLTKRFRYDNQGNVTKCVEDGVEEPSFETKYTYYHGRGNRLKLVEYQDGTSETYTYLEGTNLIKGIEKKDANGRTYNRCWHEYNERNVLVKKTEEKGLTDRGFSFITEVVIELNAEDYPSKVHEYAYKPGLDREHIKTTIYTYNARKQVTEEVVESKGALFFTIRRTFDDKGHCTHLEHSHEGYTQYWYDESGHCCQKKEKGILYTYINNRLGQCVQCVMEDESGKQVKDYSQYSSIGQKTTYRDYYGNTHHYSWQGEGNVACEYINGMYRNRYRYDSQGLLVQKELPQLGAITYRYTSWGDKKEVLYPDGTKELYAYDQSRRLVAYTDRNGIRTTYFYNERNECIQEKNGNIVESLSYEGGLLKSRRRLGREEERFYDAQQRICKSVIKEQGLQTTTVYSYSGLGQLVKEHVLEDDKSTVYAYNDRNQRIEKKVTQQGVPLLWERYEYGLSRKVAVCIDRLNENHCDRFKYDLWGRLVEKKNGEGKTVISYTNKREGGKNVSVQTVEYPNGLRKIETKDGFDGLVFKELVYEGKVLWRECNSFHPNGLIATTKYFDKETPFLQLHYSYDKNGYISSLEEVNSLGRLKTQFIHDLDGHVVFEKKEDCEGVYTSYDERGRLSRVRGEYCQLDYHYVYNDRNQLTSIEDKKSKKKSEWLYDADGVLIEEKFLHGLSVQKQKDTLGRLKQLCLPKGVQIAYTYKNNGVVSFARKNNEGKVLYTEQHQFQPRIDQLHNGKIKYHRTRKGDLEQSSSSYFSEKVCDRNTLGNITKYRSLEGEFSCEYCPLSQRICHGEERLAITPYHKITSINSKPLQYTPMMECLKHNDISYTYDKKGRRTSSSDGKEYKYDCLDRLTALNINGVRWEYLYDGMDRRVSKIRFIKDQGFWRYEAREDYLYDEGDEIGYLRNDQLVFKAPLYTIGMKKRFASIEIDQKPYALQSDLLGNVAALIDLKGDTPLERYRYSLLGFGSTLGLEGIVKPTCPYRFQGKRCDDESGLVYFHKRFYDPSIGQFITKDPLGYQEGPYMYAYARNLTGVYADVWGYKSSTKNYFYDVTDSPFSFIASPFNYKFRKAIDDNSDPTLISVGQFNKKSDSCFFYINGINTTLNEVCGVGRMLSSNLKQEVNCFYVPSHGLPFDILRAYHERKGFRSKNVYEFYYALENSLKNHKKVGVFAHSAGAGVSYQAIKMLPDRYRKQLSVYTFGPSIAIPKEFAKKVVNIMSDDDMIFHVMRGRKSDINFIQQHPMEEGGLKHSIAGRTYRSIIEKIIKGI